MKGLDNEKVEESLEKIPVVKRRLYTVLIWFFTAVAYFSFGFYDEVKLLFFAVFIPLVGTALKEPAMFKALMFPKSLRDWFWGLKIIVACRAGGRKSGRKLTWKQQASCVLLLSNVIPIVFLIAVVDVFYTPVLNLDEMDIYEGGVIKAIYSTGRRGRGPVLWLKTAKGRIVRFVSVGTEADIQYLKELNPDDVIKVWSQNVWNVVGLEVMRREVRQLQHGHFYLKKYDKNVLLRNTPKTKLITYIVFSYVFVTLSFLWVRGNNYKKRGVI